MLALSLCLAVAMPQGAGAPVVINEVLYDVTNSPDDREFVELYNVSGVPVDISNWRLDSEDPLGSNGGYVIPPGTVLPGNGFWVMGSPAVGAVNQVLVPVSGVELWENDNESLILRDATGAIVDTVVYETNKGVWPSALAYIEGEGIWGNLQALSGAETSWQRIRDGWDLGNNGLDFVLLPITPGASNNLTGALPLNDNFDAYSIDQPLNGWGTSFVLPAAIDPTQVSQLNFNAIPASPQGGQAMVAWDPSGGGNNDMLLTEMPPNVVFEAWVYFDAVPEATGEYESWSLGFGTSASYFNSPDPGGLFGFTANGNTGINWTYQVTEKSATLYFVDQFDGGWGATAQTPPKVIGQITIQPGVNDGWQRLRLERNGDTVLGSFGGSGFGCADGQTFAAHVFANQPTTLYIGYRESLGTNIVTARPFTADDVRIRATNARLLPFGSASPTSTGTPTLTANGPPTVGFSKWQIELADMPPSTTAALVLGTQRQQPPIQLSSAGAPTTAQLFVIPFLTLGLRTDATGHATLKAPLACNPTWVGTSLYWQAFALDPALGAPLPLADTAGLQTTISD